MEADSSVGDEALALVPDENLDLDHHETAQGFRMIKKQAKLRKVFDSRKGDKFVSVLIFNQKKFTSTGSGKKQNVGQLIRFFEEADIIIDAHNPLIMNILQWAK